MTVLTRRDRWWQVGVWIVLAFGVSTSLFLSWSWHAKLRADDRAAFRTQAWSLARVVGSGLSRDTDFAATVRSLVATTPQLTNPEFAHYIASVERPSVTPAGWATPTSRRFRRPGSPPFRPAWPPIRRPRSHSPVTG